MIFIVFLLTLLNLFAFATGIAGFCYSKENNIQHKLFVGMFIFPGYLLGYYLMKLILTPVGRKK